MSVNLNKATSSPRRKPHILIVGGGAAGVGIAQRLSAALSKSASSYDLTLLTSRDYYLHLIGLLRPLVTPNDTLEKRILIPYDNIFAKSLGGPGSVKVGEVVSVAKNPQGKTGGSVTLQNGETIDWDVLVLTPGNKWEGGLDLPKTVEEAEEAIKEWRDRFRKAEHVVLVGGGAVGVELAGELRDEYPLKPITLVHSLPHLLNDTYTVRYRKALETRLEKRNIKLVLGDRVDSIPNPGPTTIVTANGVKIEADLVIPTRGGKPNTSFLFPTFSSDITPSGHLRIKPTLQLASETHIFAAGDVIDWEEQHQAAKTYAHADTITANVQSVLKGEDAKAKYKGSLEMILVTVGKEGGALYMGILWGLVFGDWLSRMMKSRSLFIDMTRKMLHASN